MYKKYVLVKDGIYGDLENVIGKTLVGRKKADDSDIVYITGEELLLNGATNPKRDEWIPEYEYVFIINREVKEVTVDTKVESKNIDTITLTINYDDGKIEINGSATMIGLFSAIEAMQDLYKKRFTEVVGGKKHE